MFDDEGRKVGAIVTREPEWDDEQRAAMEDLVAYEAEVHDLCGLHDSVAKADPYITIDGRDCPLCAQVAAKVRVLGESDHKEAEALREAPGSVRRSDGVFRFVRMMTPAEIAAVERAKAKRRAQ